MQKLFSSILFAITGLTALAFPLISQADFSDLTGYQNLYHLSSFDSNIQINSDSTILVTEKITANFTPQDTGRGIIRSIPTIYRDANNLNLNIRLTIKSVTDAALQPLEYATYQEGAVFNIRIGNREIWLSQPQTYLITYQLDRGINYFENYDEFYWNVTGNQWDAPIGPSTATIALPAESDKNNFQLACYTGSYGSTETKCTTAIIDNQKVKFTSSETIKPGQGLTIIFAFPKNLVQAPPFWLNWLWLIVDNLILVGSILILPIITFAILYYKWLQEGKDPTPSRTTIMPEYSAPDNLTPAEVGTLIDDSIDDRDLTATIIHLATRGYLKIHQESKKGLFEQEYYTLEKTTPQAQHQLLFPNDQLNEFEKEIYENIFGDQEKVKLNDLKYRFYKAIQGIKIEIQKRLIDQKYFAHSFLGIKNQYFSFGVGMIFIPLIFIPAVYGIYLPLSVGYILSAIIIMVFSGWMTQKTQKGVDALQRIRGLAEFIRTAEADRLKMYEKEHLFEKILPYAIALGMADRWVKVCSEVFKEMPEWYQTSHTNIHNLNYSFAHALNSFTNTWTTVSTAAPRTSASSGRSGFSGGFGGGGGFSGGGFGGGGGGRW